MALCANVGTVQGQNAIVEAAVRLSESDSINILVHNAGNGDDCFLPEVSEEFYEMQTDINVKGIQGPLRVRTRELTRLFCSSYFSHAKGSSAHATRWSHHPGQFLLRSHGCRTADRVRGLESCQ